MSQKSYLEFDSKVTVDNDITGRVCGFFESEDGERIKIHCFKNSFEDYSFQDLVESEFLNFKDWDTLPMTVDEFNSCYSHRIIETVVY